MKYLTRAWYQEFYGNQQETVSYEETMEQSKRIIREFNKFLAWQYAQDEQMPPDSPFREFDFHDAIVYQIDYSDGIIVLHMDTSNTITKKEYCCVTFSNAILISKKVQVTKGINLEWFTCEVEYLQTNYRVGIVLKPSIGLEPAILEFTAGDVKVS